jgi:DNA-binding XRE family transcriptional regulator
MNMWDLKKWRRMLGYSQFEAAEVLGVSRAAIQHWECERNPVPYSAELACEEITRRWKQRPAFGPVVLIYADEPLWPEPDCPSRVLCVQCELHPDNDAVIRRACRLRKAPNFTSALVIDEGGEVVWNGAELLNECDKR